MERYIGGSEMQFGIAPAEASATEDVVRTLSAEVIRANNYTQLHGVPLGSSRSALFNGGFLELDMGHPEYATPECRTLDDLVAHEYAGRMIVESLLHLATLGTGIKAYAVANNTDHHYSPTTDALNVFAYHENYAAKAPEEEVAGFLPFLVTRQVFAGSGVVIPSVLQDRFGGEYALSQRALGVNMQTGALTVGFYSRLIGANRQNASILHVTLGDCNVSAFATKLKVGACALVHQLLEDGWQPPAFLSVSDGETLGNIRRLALAPSRANFDNWQYRTSNGVVSAIEVQRVYLQAAERYRGRDVETDWVLSAWSTCLDQLERDPMEARQLDWVAKKVLIDRLRATRLGTDDLIKADVSYHVANQQRSLSQLASVDVPSEDVIQQAVAHAPTDTRAAGREIGVRAAGTLVEAIGPRHAGHDWTFWCKWHMVGYSSRARRRSRTVMMRDPSKTYAEEAAVLAQEILELC